LVAELYAPLREGNISLLPLSEEHREALRAACAEDQEIWEIYPFSYLGQHFDMNFALMLNGIGGRQPYAIFNGNELVG
jgi:hypothetical protein